MKFTSSLLCAALLQLCTAVAIEDTDYVNSFDCTDRQTAMLALFGDGIWSQFDSNFEPEVQERMVDFLCTMGEDDFAESYNCFAGVSFEGIGTCACIESAFGIECSEEIVIGLSQLAKEEALKNFS